MTADWRKCFRAQARNIETEIHNAQFTRKHSDIRATIQQLRADAQTFLKSPNSLNGAYLLDLPGRAIKGLPKARRAVTEVVTLCEEALSDISPKGGSQRPAGAWQWRMARARARATSGFIVESGMPER